MGKYSSDTTTPDKVMLNQLTITVISGGTATNELVSLFESVSPNVNYILPILDNGGSTSELIRIIGGPAIGDIRSRLTRLIPESQEALRSLLSFRLLGDPRTAKVEWNEIVEGTHELWHPIQPATKEIVRAFFIHVNVELLKRSKHNTNSHANKRHFRYELANIGNLFLTGVRLFIGSLDSAIELFSKLTGIDPRVNVIPCINTNFTYHISALLENGLIITGQSQISHPSQVDTSVDIYPPPIDTTRPSTPSSNLYRTNYFGVPSIDGLSIDTPLNDVAIANFNRNVPRDSFGSFLSNDDDSDQEEAGSVPQYTHPELKKSQLHFNKTENIEPLLSPIKRIFYVSPYGQEICPTAHTRVTSTLATSDIIVYSIGSLMTSIVPIVILKGVGRSIAMNLNDESKSKKKIMLLNGCADRETFGMTATDFLRVIVELATYSLERAMALPNENIDVSNVPWNRYITHLVYMKDPNIHVDVEYLENIKGIKCVEVTKVHGTDYFDLDNLKLKLHNITYDITN